MTNPFFTNKGPFEINKLLKLLDLAYLQNFKNKKVYDITDLSSSSSKDITFFHSKKYENEASNTKASPLYFQTLP